MKKPSFNFILLGFRTLLTLNRNKTISLKEIVEFVTLDNNFKPKQKKEIKVDIDIFEKEFLCQDCNVDYTCYEMIQELLKQINEFIENIIYTNNQIKRLG